MVRIEGDTYYYKKNIGPGKIFPGGDTCESLGKEVLCMVIWIRKRVIMS